MLLNLSNDATATVAVDQWRRTWVADIQRQCITETAAVADACRRYPHVMAASQDAGSHKVMCRGLTTLDVMATYTRRFRLTVDELRALMPGENQQVTYDPARRL